jgi:uncharacterized coiled-coil DUF342 family protein
METKKKRTTLNDLGEMLAHVVKHMATKEELAEVKEDIVGIKQDIVGVKEDIVSVKQDIVGIKEELTAVKNTMATASELDIVRRDVAIIKEKTESHDGFAKEIDHTISRIVVIEKHLGLAK